jgi:hypothetical protein
VYRLTGVLALAHGDIVVGAVFVGVLVVVGTAPVASTPGFATAHDRRAVRRMGA